MNDVRITVQHHDKHDKIIILVQRQGVLKKNWYTYKTIVIDKELDVKVFNTGTVQTNYMIKGDSD